MRILVTGAAGFVGGHLAERLLREGHEVLALDNLSFGRRDHIPGAAEFWQVDLGTVDEAQLSAGVAAFKPDYVVHLAAIHFIPYCMAHPGETFAVNVRGTDVVMRSLVQCSSVTKVVAASTMDVYAPGEGIHRETDSASPRNIYGLSKLLSEQIVRYSAEICDRLSAVCLRFANVYGPRETNPHLIPDTLKRIQSKAEPEIRMGYLGGERDFIHVTDIVQGILACLFADTGKYEVFNVGTGVATSVRRVVQTIRDAYGDERPIVEDTGKLRDFDRKSLTPDIRKIQGTLGWEPRVQLEEGIKSLVMATTTDAPSVVQMPVVNA